MIYFKRTLSVHDDKINLESSLRKASIKRTFFLELTPSINIGTDKLFFGFEGKKALFFTRIQTSVEYFLPKIIIKLEHGASKFDYKIRLSIISTIIFVGFTCITSMALVGDILNNGALSDFLLIAAIYSIYLVLIYVEFSLTSRNIGRAMKNH